jgi:hypothetical protein
MYDDMPLAGAGAAAGEKFKKFENGGLLRQSGACFEWLKGAFWYSCGAGIPDFRAIRSHGIQTSWF